MRSDNEYSLKKRIADKKISYFMITPFMICFIMFTLIPIIAAICISFTDFNMFAIPKFVFMENFKRLLLNDDLFFTAVKNTLVFVVVTGPLSYLTALMMAWVINEMPRRIRVFMTVVFYIPSISGNVFFIWKFLFSGDVYGYFNGILMRFGIINEPILWFNDVRYVLPVIMVVQVWLSLGAGFLAFIAGFQSIDPNQYEAGALDGIRNRFQEFFYITIPNMKDMLLFGAVMQIANTFSVGAITQELAGGFMSSQNAALTIINHMNDYGMVRYEMGYACAIAVILFLCVLAVKNLVFRLLKWK